FLRATVIDTGWFLLGNRSSVIGQPVDGDKIHASLQPQVRDRIAITYLTDGVDVLAQGAQVIGRLFGTAGASGLGYAVSPVLDPAVGCPPSTGPTGHWPNYPVQTNPTQADFPAGMTSPVAGMTAAWSGPGPH